MAEKVLITGGTGLIGKKIIPLLRAAGYDVHILTRNPKGVNSWKWDPYKGILDDKALEGTRHIVHLAGAGVADKRWDKAYKKEILDSRILSTRLLAEKIKQHPSIQSFVSASAIGIYGSDTDANWIDEISPKGHDFLANVVHLWEEEVFSISDSVRKVAFRIGIVLDSKEGALPKLSLPVRYGVGAPLGDGEQYISWIHVHDLARLFVHAVQNTQLEGIYNAVGPAPVTNRVFTKAIANQLHRPLWLPPVPGFMMKALIGEMAASVLGGNRVSNAKIVSQGFQYSFPTLESALKDLL